MRSVLAASMVFLSLASAHAQAPASKPVKLGVLNDQSGQYADAAGPAAVEVAKMAIADFGGKLLGQPIEVVFADHQNKPDIASGIARRWIDTEGVDVILDIGNSAVALALADLVRDKNKMMIVSSAGASAITNEKCSPNTFQWTYNTYTLARSTAKALMGQGGNEWYFLTADYAFGQAFESDASAVLKESGGKVVGSVRHPFNTSDFSSFLLQAQNSSANVLALANAGGDTTNSLMQAHEFGLLGQKSKMRVAALLFQITDAKSVGLPNLQGLYTSEAFYWNRNDASRAFGKRFFDKVGRMPTMVQAGMYSATMHYLKAVEAAGTLDTAAVLAKFRSMPVNDFFSEKGYVREDGMHIHDYYLLRAKTVEQSKGPWDFYEVVATVPAEDANIPREQSKCSLMRKS
ncbi:ABC transporter substrate-binding protein [Bradyrhizobium vignae]|uniref:Putative substrate-binding component of ABC transporter n=1 Tax=Bradyrhizobium vignae TaxID=1549949 RepID=A0A2U3Q8J2_9BRAD|nr:ABC transporter substrate-binding protein [Bradyrhizobium vignae]SPP97700.1 putative substrate-binding component of ABC transporter [Bradyrhizobium vignae]